MPQISNTAFSVRFNLQGTPTLVLTDTTSTPPSGLVGIFSITQPDGYTRTGDINTPDISAAGGTYSYTLRLDSTGGVQRGTYKIVYTAAAPGYLSTEFTREFQFTYSPVELDIREEFDVFTPNLSVVDDTVYSVSNYNNGSVTRAWSAVSTPTGTITGSSQTLSLQFGGEYYDANYAITLASSITYTHQTYSWLTITETISKTLNTYAETPPSPTALVTLIEELKNKYDESVNTCQTQDAYRQDFEFAQALFKHIVDRILVDNTDGIFDDLKDLVRVLSNNQIPTYTPTNLPIPPYDISIFAPGAAWGNIVGTITNQTDLVAYIANLLNLKVDKTTTVNGKALSTNITITKSDVGLGNVDNTSDLNKPISTAAQAEFTNIYNLLNNVGGVEQYANFAAFPVTGDVKKLYIDKDKKQAYYWDAAYVKIGVFLNDIIVSLSGGKTVGRYGTGQTIPAQGKTAEEVFQLIAVEPINPTVSLTSPTSIAFNQTAISNVLNFSYVINSLGASVASVSLEWRRNNTGSWTVLSTNTGITTFTHSLTDTNFNTQPFNYRYIVTDSAGGTATATVNITPAAYVAPSISFSVGSTTRDRGDINTTVSGTITRNSANVALSSYQVQQSVNGGSWTNVGSSVSISGASASISVNDNNASLINSNTIAYRVQVVDAFTTTTSGTITISFVHRNFLGYSTNTTIDLAGVLGLASSVLQDSRVRTVTGVTATGGNYTYYAYNASSGDLTSIILDGAAPVLGAFTKQGDLSGTNAFGANVTYRVYRSNATNAFNNNSLAFS